MLKTLMFVQTPSALPLLASQALSTSRFSSTEGVGAVALFCSRTSKAQSLDQGYPRKSVAEVRADSPPFQGSSLLVYCSISLLCQKFPLKSPGHCRRTSRPEILSPAPQR